KPQPRRPRPTRLRCPRRSDRWDKTAAAAHISIKHKAAPKGAAFLRLQRDLLAHEIVIVVTEVRHELVTLALCDLIDTRGQCGGQQSSRRIARREGAVRGGSL